MTGQDYYPPCDECGEPFTQEDWEDRHTPDADALAEVHAECCQDCL